MIRTFLISKLHQVRVTHADLEYEGSFGIDSEILEAAGILENEMVHVYNLDKGTRFSTYAIPEPAKSRRMQANGACAHLVSPGDRVIICVYADLNEEEWKAHQPTVLFMDEKNNFRYKQPYENAHSETCFLHTAEV